MAADESLVVVLVAMAANIVLAILKFIAYLLTGSPSMLAQTYHSISDTGNQILLLIGMYYAKKRANRLHPFGHGKAIFFYSFLVSVLLFGIAGWESLQTGVRALRAGAPVELPSEARMTALGIDFRAIYMAYAVLIATIILDGISYIKARQALNIEIEERQWRGFREAFQKTSDMPVLAVLTENAVAGVGAAIALVAIFVSDVTGIHVFDAGGAVLIGLLLMIFALALGRENKRLLLGEALPEAEEETLEAVVVSASGVEELIDFRTVYFGPDNVLVVADVSFDPSLGTEEIERTIGDIEADLKEREEAIGRVYIEPTDAAGPVIQREP
ncbi:MAG: cation diffusion facilitator family transporter [Natronomonas sp.]